MKNWREIISSKNTDTYEQYPQNPQYSPKGSNIANCADIVDKGIKTNDVLEGLVATVAKYYDYSLEDINDLKEAASKDPNGVTNALQKQVDDLSLLRTLELTWEEIPATYTQMVIKGCNYMKYDSNKQKQFMDQLNTLSLSGILSEITILKEIIDYFEKPTYPISPWDRCISPNNMETKNE